MKQLQVIEKQRIEEFDIEVIPYITLQEQMMVVQTMLTTNNYIHQQQLLVAGVLYCCTDLLKGKEETAEDNPDLTDINFENYTYEDLVYSGFWEAFLQQCPYIKQAVSDIKRTVEKYQSTEYIVSTLVDKTSNLLDSGTELFEVMKSKIKDKKFNKRITEAIVKAVEQTQGMASLSNEE